MDRHIAKTIADELRLRISRGDYRNERFPSVRGLQKDDVLRAALGAELGIQSTRTALAMLVGEGLIASQPNRRIGFQVQRPRRGLIGLVGFSPTGDFMGRMIDGINEELANAAAREADKQPYRLVCSFIHPRDRDLGFQDVARAEDKLIGDLASETDGLLFLPAGRVDRIPSIRRLHEARFPLVLLGPGYQPEDFVPFAGVPQVVYSEKTIARKVAAFAQQIVNRDGLMKSPPRMIAIIGEASNAVLYQRASEITRSLLQMKLQPRQFLSNLTREAAGQDGIEQAQRFIIKGRTLIIATTDMVGLGALNALRDRTISVPEHATLMAVDDDEPSEFVGLTSLKLYPNRVAMVATRAVTDMADTDDRGAPEIVVETAVGEIQRRASTGVWKPGRLK